MYTLSQSLYIIWQITWIFSNFYVLLQVCFVYHLVNIVLYAASCVVCVCISVMCKKFVSLHCIIYLYYRYYFCLLVQLHYLEFLFLTWYRNNKQCFRPEDEFRPIKNGIGHYGAAVMAQLQFRKIL